MRKARLFELFPLKLFLYRLWEAWMSLTKWLYTFWGQMQDCPRMNDEPSDLDETLD